MPETWLSSFHYDGDGQLLTQLSHQYPTINVLDTGAIITQIQQILQQVSQALEVMVVLVIFCGLLLLLAQIQVGMSQRERELVVYRTLGASKKLMRRTLWSEFALLGEWLGSPLHLVLKSRYGYCKLKCLIFHGNQNGGCGYCYLFAQGSYYPYAVAG